MEDHNGIPWTVGSMFSQMLENHANVVLIAAQDKATGEPRYLVFRAINRGQDNMTGLELLAEMLPLSNGRGPKVTQETRPHPESGLPEDAWTTEGPDVPSAFR